MCCVRCGNVCERDCSNADIHQLQFEWVAFYMLNEWENSNSVVNWANRTFECIMHRIQKGNISIFHFILSGFIFCFFFFFFFFLRIECNLEMCHSWNMKQCGFSNCTTEVKYFFIPQFAQFQRKIWSTSMQDFQEHKVFTYVICMKWESVSNVISSKLLSFEFVIQRRSYRRRGASVC